MRFATTLFVIATMAPMLMAAGRPAARVPEAARQTIEHANAAWVAAMKGHGDMTAVSGGFAPDALFITPDGQIVRGGDAIVRFMKERLARSGPAVRGGLVQDGIRREGSLVYEWGHVTLEFPPRDGKPVKMTGRYLTVWARDAAGHWQITRNLSLPQ
ncbi:MAG: nuclear transport factor 2 family protein [Acidobacteriota bacterium]|nr:nuclear transport factor 2 family protein [Acidobacteriota bacterium]